VIEHCSKCGRERPDYIAEPTCELGGYCNWQEPRPCSVCSQPATFRFRVEVAQRTDDAFDARGTMILWRLWFLCRMCAFRNHSIQWYPPTGEPLTRAEVTFTQT
jgi:hypothetical protein